MIDPDRETPLSRTAASEAVPDIGWRFLLGTLCASVPTDSLTHASEVKRPDQGVHFPRVKVGCQRPNGQKKTEMTY
jgi:hypothetical protein